MKLTAHVRCDVHSVDSNSTAVSTCTTVTVTMILQEYPPEIPDLCPPSLDELGIPAFKTSPSKVENMAHSTSYKWEEIIEEGTQRYSDTSTSNHR